MASPLRPLRAEKCNLCLRYVLLPMSRNGHVLIFRPLTLNFQLCVLLWGVVATRGLSPPRDRGSHGVRCDPAECGANGLSSRLDRNWDRTRRGSTAGIPGGTSDSELL